MSNIEYRGKHRVRRAERKKKNQFFGSPDKYEEHDMDWQVHCA